MRLIVMISTLMLLTACGGRDTQRAVVDTGAVAGLTEAEKGFMDNLRSLCGKSFAGEQTYMAEGRPSWEHYDFVMHVTVCEEDRVHIPFHLSDDHSRTWLFLAEEEGLRFRHDHRYEDGTPEARNLYGGYSDGTGSAFEQHFPADDYTIELLTDTLNRKWSVIIDEDLEWMVYRLSYHGETVFEGKFDLSEPINR